MEPGQRVGVICGTKGDVVEIFGFGVYEGAFPIGDDAVGAVADMAREVSEEEGTEPLLNPRLRLDSGQVVWGCECWWGAEAKVREQIAGMTIVEVDIDKVRKSVKQETR